MKFPIPPTALPDDSDKTQQRPPMPPDLDRFPASVYTVFRFMSSGNRTAVAPPTPPGPKGSNGNGCCRVSGSQKGATRLRPFSLTPPWLRHDIRLSAGAFLLNFTLLPPPRETRAFRAHKKGEDSFPPCLRPLFLSVSCRIESGPMFLFAVLTSVHRGNGRVHTGTGPLKGSGRDMRRVVSGGHQ